MEGYIQSTILHLDPVEGKLTEKLAPPMNLPSHLEGYTVESLFTTNHEKISLQQICKQVAEQVEEPHKVANFIKALVDPALASRICGQDLWIDDPAGLKKVLDEEHIIEGFEILDKVEELQNKYLIATRKIQLLEFNVWDLTEKIKLLEADICIREQIGNEEEEQDVVSPLQSMYLPYFHEEVREAIAAKLSVTALHTHHQKALRLRLHGGDEERRLLQNNLWRFMQDMHAACPGSFSASTMWNQFVEELLAEKDLVALLGLSPQAILITRFGTAFEDLASQNPELNSGADTASAFRNKHVFAELVTRLDEEQRPSYTELYQFLFDSAPESMNFKTICSPPEVKCKRKHCVLNYVLGISSTISTEALQ